MMMWTKIANLITLKVNDWIFQIMSSVLALAIFLSLYIGLVGAVISYYYFKKNRDSLNGYMNAIKYSPMITKILVKFWTELKSSFKYDIMLIQNLKHHDKKHKDNHELNKILNDQILLEEHEVLFESTTLFLLTNTKNFFRFR